MQSDGQHGCNGTRRVQWQPLNTGTCPVKYTIQFRNSKGDVIGTVVNMNNSTSYCTNDYDNAISVVMWATYNGTQGNTAEAELVTTTPEPSTPTTITPPTTTQKGTKLYYDVYLSCVVRFVVSHYLALA